MLRVDRGFEVYPMISSSSVNLLYIFLKTVVITHIVDIYYMYCKIVTNVFEYTDQKRVHNTNHIKLLSYFDQKVILTHSD